MGGGKYKRVYLDSSVYLAAIKGEVGRAEQVRQVLTAADQGLIEIVVSTWAVVEVYKIKHEEPIDEDVEAAIDKIMLSDKLIMVELDLSLAQESRRMARIHQLNPGDSVHLATAIRHRAEFLFKYDGRFKARSEIAGLTLCEPYWFGDAPMPGLEPGKS